MQHAGKMCIFPTPLKAPYGYVYLARVKSQVPFYKIGTTKNLKSRKMGVQSAIGSDIDYIAYAISDQPKVIEYILHIYMSDNRLDFIDINDNRSREYYTLTTTDVQYVIEQLRGSCYTIWVRDPLPL